MLSGFVNGFRGDNTIPFTTRFVTMSFDMDKSFLLVSAILFSDYCCSSDYTITRSGFPLVVVTTLFQVSRD